jgi:hypothetical protein
MEIQCPWSVVLSGTPASSITKTGRHDIAEILLKVALYTKNQSKFIQKIPNCNHKLCNIEVITSKNLWSPHDLINRYGISVSQMTTDIFHLS